MDKKGDFIKGYIKKGEKLKYLGIMEIILVGVFIILCFPDSTVKKDIIVNYNFIFSTLIVVSMFFILIASGMYRSKEVEINNFYINRRKFLLIKRELMIIQCLKITLIIQSLSFVKDIFLSFHEKVISLNWVINNILLFAIILMSSVIIFELATIVNTCFAHRPIVILPTLAFIYLYTTITFKQYLYNKDGLTSILIILVLLFLTVVLFKYENRLNRKRDEKDEEIIIIRGV